MSHSGPVFVAVCQLAAGLFVRASASVARPRTFDRAGYDDSVAEGSGNSSGDDDRIWLPGNIEVRCVSGRIRFTKTLVQ